MSYLFYKDLISEIAIKLQYDSVVHLLGRDYSDEETMNFVNNQNPFFINLDEDKNNSNSKSKQNSNKITIGALKDLGMFNQK